MLEIIDNADLSTRTSLRLQGRVDRLIRVHHPAELADVKRALRGSFRGLLGEGSNSVFGAHIQGTLLQIAWRGYERIGHDRILAHAGEHWDELVQWSLCQGLQGLENLSMIPGSVGAAPIQNIGAYGVELSQCFVALEAIHWESMTRKRFSLEDCQFSYRSSVFKAPSHQHWIISHIELQLNRQATSAHLLSGQLASDHLPAGHLRSEYQASERLTSEHLTSKHLQSEHLASDAEAYVHGPSDQGRPSPTSMLNFRYPDLQAHFRDSRPQTALELAQVIRQIRSSKLPDPEIEPNAGSFFHNPRLHNEAALALKARFPRMPIYPDGAHHHKLSAAWMIDQCGLKGQREGDVGVSAKHALVLVNYGKASGDVLIAFAQGIIDLVQARFGLQLTIEPRVLLA